MLYLTGIYYEECDKWECEGVYDTEEQALDELPDHDHAFIISAELNQRLPEHVKDAEMVWFANIHTKEQDVGALNKIKHDHGKN